MKFVVFELEVSPQKSQNPQNAQKNFNRSAFCVFCIFVFFVVNQVWLLRRYRQRLPRHPGSRNAPIRDE
jgi:hypothetical protein